MTTKDYKQLTGLDANCVVVSDFEFVRDHLYSDRLRDNLVELAKMVASKNDDDLTETFHRIFSIAHLERYTREAYERDARDITALVEKKAPELLEDVMTIRCYSNYVKMMHKLDEGIPLTENEKETIKKLLYERAKD